MHVGKILHKLLAEVTHGSRLRVLSAAVMGVLRTKRISVTQIGRGLVNQQQERSAIRQADRLVGNKHLHQERSLMYQQMMNFLIGSRQLVPVLVDWSQIPNATHHVLRAALVTKGRALTLYEEVHREKKLGNKQVQDQFLEKLGRLLPAGCQVIVITDAGFHGPWFRKIQSMGWDYVGRVRGTYQMSLDGGETWRHCRKLFPKASPVARWWKDVMFGKENPQKASICLIKELPRGRKSYTRQGKKRRDTKTKDYRRSAKEPWLLVSSLNITSFLVAKRVINFYKTRMQIEEAFRDLKSSRYGFGFEEAFSKQIKRIENMLLIASLASMYAWLVGCYGEAQGLHREFQVNSSKRRVLSLFFLGCRMIYRGIKVPIHAIESCFYRGLLS